LLPGQSTKTHPTKRHVLLVDQDNLPTFL